MKPDIHPTAIVAPECKLGDGVRIGAYATIESNVNIGDRTWLREHAIVRSGSRIGADCKIHPFVVIGEEPQHLAYKGEETTVTIGDHVTLREFVTVHRGTSFGGYDTRIGNNAYIMAYSHVAHDCAVGKNVIIANAVQLAGHVELGDFVTIGGHSAVAQFVKVGSFCFVGGGSVIRKDLPPFLLGKGHEFEVQGINAIGLTRNGYSDVTVKRLRSLYKIFFLQSLTVPRAIEKILQEIGDGEDIRTFVDFVKASKNGLHR